MNTQTLYWHFLGSASSLEQCGRTSATTPVVNACPMKRPICTGNWYCCQGMRFLLFLLHCSGCASLLEDSYRLQPVVTVTYHDRNHRRISKVTHLGRVSKAVSLASRPRVQISSQRPATDYTRFHGLYLPCHFWFILMTVDRTSSSSG
jgi:hypothetical protein